METEEPDLNNPTFWLSKSPDRLVLAIISLVFRYWIMVNALLLILKLDSNIKDVKLQDGRNLSALLEDIEPRHNLLKSNLQAASQWVEAYKQGKIDLEPYRSPYAKDNEQDIKES